MAKNTGPVFVLDKHVDPDTIRASLEGTIVQSQNRRPRLRYSGPHKDDEDRYHVLQLGFENDATVVTCDQEFLEKARDFQRCGSHGHFLNGVIVLPPGKEAQKKALTAFLDGTLQVIGIDQRSPVIEQIQDSNLGVNLLHKQPIAQELCDCPWLDEEERRRTRYKRK